MILILRKHQETVPGTWDKGRWGIISPEQSPGVSRLHGVCSATVRWTVPTQVLAKPASWGLSSHAYPSLTPFSWASTFNTSEAAAMPEPEGEPPKYTSILALLNWKHWGQIMNMNGDHREAFRFESGLETPQSSSLFFQRILKHLPAVPWMALTRPPSPLQRVSVSQLTGQLPQDVWLCGEATPVLPTGPWGDAAYHLPKFGTLTHEDRADCVAPKGRTRTHVLKLQERFSFSLNLVEISVNCHSETNEGLCSDRKNASVMLSNSNLLEANLDLAVLRG